VVSLPVPADDGNREQPPSAGPGEAAAAPEASAQAATAARRVLVVDDNRDSAESLATLLTLAGHDTRRAHDGLEALAEAERHRPHAVLLDLGLPKLDGYEVCRRLREQAWGADTVVIALSGWGQQEHRARADEAGFDAHLVKPVDFAVLARLLASPPAGRRGD
jgi:DNA-binding response OmpR family regulator